MPSEKFSAALSIALLAISVSARLAVSLPTIIATAVRPWERFFWSPKLTAVTCSVKLL